jgi:REP element-mobilizing transposase RayT
MSYAHSNLRRGRHSQSGQVYLVTFTTMGRRTLFADWPVAVDAARLLSAPYNWQASTLLAWVLMPDHWHGLLQLGEDDALPKRVGWVKAQCARLLRKAHGLDSPVWSRAYHDRALRADEDLVAAARYIVMNPVRAGLAARAGDYPFWDAVWVGQANSSRL